jgi:hypothetical protein
MNKKAILIGVAGGLVAFGIVYLIGWYLKKRKEEIEIVESGEGGRLIEMTADEQQAQLQPQSKYAYN